VAALNGPQEHLKDWLAEFDRRRRYACERLNAMPGVSCVASQGAFYLFPNIAKCGLSSADFCGQLLDKAQVAAIPGMAFGADEYIRISYAIAFETIAKGMDRLEAFVRTLV
jgi:aspartate aminotransferase